MIFCSGIPSSFANTIHILSQFSLHHHLTLVRPSPPNHSFPTRSSPLRNPCELIVVCSKLGMVSGMLPCAHCGRIGRSLCLFADCSHFLVLQLGRFDLRGCRWKSDRSWRQLASAMNHAHCTSLLMPRCDSAIAIQVNIHSSDEVDSFVFGNVLSSQHESSSAQRIVGETIAFVWRVVRSCSSKKRLRLFKDDLIAKIIPSLNLLTLPFAGAEDLHYHLMFVIANFLWLSTPFGLASLELSHLHEHQALHETVLKQVLMPSEAYLRHLCVNCHSIVDGNQSTSFVLLLAQILRICPFHDPTFKFVQTLPIFLTLPNTLSFFEKDTISTCISEMCRRSGFDTVVF
ncbi:hypothetical protein BLNAU_1148 [Blattamonas nauphoetae]|uniref:Uncharacterized protein n=1 Tax=Blattamonas nauphoetae TaxID=2049346 RepID=A0ABQ9YJX4_9EUKA|nr:hypothetical protein BLNAU_1148 [Blattamonas nauphoetae]